MTIKDPCGRTVSNLRISITQRCSLNCLYCHKEGEHYKASTEMAPGEIERIVRMATAFGINRIKLTGGEPLLRADVVEIVQRLSNIPTIREVSMTTNGLLLSKLVKPLKKSGLKRVNVSLCGLNSETYTAVTKTDLLSQVLEGVKEAAVLVPQQAVARDSKGEPYAFVVDQDGKARQRTITVDRTIADKWLVSSGLSAGDRVIIEGMQKVKPGQPVKAVALSETSKEGEAQAEAVKKAQTREAKGGK